MENEDFIQNDIEVINEIVDDSVLDNPEQEIEEVNEVYSDPVIQSVLSELVQNYVENEVNNSDSESETSGSELELEEETVIDYSMQLTEIISKQTEIIENQETIIEYIKPHDIFNTPIQDYQITDVLLVGVLIAFCLGALFSICKDYVFKM